MSTWHSPLDPPPTEVGVYIAKMDPPTDAERADPSLVTLRRKWKGRCWSQCWRAFEPNDAIDRSTAENSEFGMYWATVPSN